MRVPSGAVELGPKISTCALAMAAPCGSATRILISAEARDNKKKRTTKTRESFIHSSFSTRKGLVVAVRAGLLASRVEDVAWCVTSDSYNRPSRAYPVTGCGFPRLQLRGSAGFSPASLFSLLLRTREPKIELCATVICRRRNLSEEKDFYHRGSEEHGFGGQECPPRRRLFNALGDV